MPKLQTAVKDLLSPLTPNARALIFADGSEISWSKLANKVFNHAKKLQKEGLKKRETKFFQQKNSPELLIDILATFACEAVPVLAHPRWPKILAENLYHDAAHSYHQFLQQEKSLKKQSKKHFLDTVATILFTSGSSGQHKSVFHTFRMHQRSAQGALHSFPFHSGQDIDAGHVWLLNLPLCHVGGISLLFRAGVHGGAIAFMQDGESLNDAINRIKPTHLSLVSTQLKRLLSDPQMHDILANSTQILLGGGPFADQDLRTAQKLNWPIHQTYGSTELASQVCTSVHSPFNCGKALAYRAIKIVEQEVWIKGDTLALGYGTKTGLQQLRNSSGWYQSGDLATKDNLGNLKILGRKDLMFISGGENIHPEMIEKALLEIKSIIQAAVVPIEDRQFGKRPVTFISFINLKTALTNKKILSIQRELEKTLPKFMIPKEFFLLPKNQSFKVKKQDLIKLLNHQNSVH